MIDKLIVGITGFKESGKDTVCNFLKPHLSKHRQTYIYHIGNTIAKTLADMTNGDVNKIQASKSDPYMRGILQYLGAERRLREGDDCFLKEAQELFNNTIVKCFILIPSIRFTNEAQWIKSQKGLIIRVFRPIADEVVDTHVTESQVRSISFDHSVLNDANMGRLEFYCKALAQNIIEYSERK